MSCSSCKKCFELADSTLVRVEDVNGVRHYEVAGSNVITTTAPASMIYTKRVPCELFEAANKPPIGVAVLEEVDADGKQTGLLVHVTQNADGSYMRTNLSDGSAYTLPAGFDLHTAEDTDYQQHQQILCDGGETVLRVTVYKDGDIADVVSTTTMKLDGSAHTLSGNETAGDCNSNKMVNIENKICFGDPSDLSVTPVMGYIRTTTDLNTDVSTTDYFDNDDNPIAAGLMPVKCC